MGSADHPDADTDNGDTVMAKITSITPAGGGIRAETAEYIFDLVDRFAAYGFNRSHAAAYGLLSYRTAWLKRHHPHEFYAGSMNLDLNQTDKLAEFAAEMRRAGIAMTPPDVNRSEDHFTVAHGPAGKSVLWALAGIKGVGASAMEQLIEERRTHGLFRDFSDFVVRASAFINKRGFENLIKAGACDGLYGNRAAMLKGLERELKSAQKSRRDEAAGQVSMFDGLMAPATTTKLPDCQDLDKLSRLWGEYDTMGMFISGHPVQVAEGLRDSRSGGVSLAQVLDAERPWRASHAWVHIICIDVIPRMTKNHEAMAIVKVSDESGTGEIAVFPESYAANRKLLKKKQPLAVKCQVNERNGERRLAAETDSGTIQPLDLEGLLQRVAA